MDSPTSHCKNNPNKTDGSRSYYYYRYETGSPVACDSEFRKFMMGNVRSTLVVPSKTGPTLKLTQKGVVQVPATGYYNVLDWSSFQDVPLFLEPISAEKFEEERKASQTKMYFSGFPTDTSSEDVKLIFNRFGEVQFVFLMKSRCRSKNGFLHGYFFFKTRVEVDKLLAYQGTLYFQSRLIKYEEFKATIPSKRQKEKKLKAAKLTKTLKATSLAEANTEQVKHSSPTPGNENLMNPSMIEHNIEQSFLPGSKKPYLNSCASVTKNLSQDSNIRFNVLLGSRQREPRRGAENLSVSLCAGHRLLPLSRVATAH